MKVHNPDNLPLANINDIMPTQGDLKDLSKANYDKLKASIDKHGFAYPLAVWLDDDKNKWLLDGHQRIRVMQKEGWKEEVPYISIPAKDQKEATELLLKITSQYGTITQEGLDTYLATYEIDDVIMDEITFDNLKHLDYSEPEIDLPDGEKDGFTQMTFILSDTQIAEVEKAVKGAKSYIDGSEDNDNGNSNALFYMARVFNEQS